MNSDGKANTKGVIAMEFIIKFALLVVVYAFATLTLCWVCKRLMGL